MLQQLLQFIREHKIIILLTVLYFFLRLVNLTKLPIFNDESIYLDWGWREITHPGYLFYSLYDAKQPLLMWIFGIAESIFSDPLWAGRFVSVLTGFITMLGLYKFGSKFLQKQVGFITAALYIITPIFSFYDRQALMESSIAAVGIWFLYLGLLFIEFKNVRYAIITGFIAGIGIFIKSSFLIFIIIYFLVLIYILFREKFASDTLKKAGIIILSILITDSTLLIQPLFWSTLHTNSRYTLTFSEIITTFPLHFLTNFIGFLEIIFIYASPLFLILGVAGIFVWLKNSRSKKIFVIAIFCLLPILFDSLLARGVSQRYIVSFLPLLCIPVAYIIHISFKKRIMVIKCASGIIFMYGIAMTLLQIISPVAYFQIGDRVSPYSDIQGYVQTQPSGFGIPQTVQYILQHASNTQVLVTTALNTGNPESAMFVYFRKNKNVLVSYLDSKEFSVNLTNYNCFSSRLPFYFISRDNQQTGFDRMFQHLVDFKNPYGKNWIGIYTLKTCSGKIFRLD